MCGFFGQMNFGHFKGSTKNDTMDELARRASGSKLPVRDWQSLAMKGL
jgi:hypothetical protein